VFWLVRTQRRQYWVSVHYFLYVCSRSSLHQCTCTAILQNVRSAWVYQILLNRLAMEMSALAESARNPRNENHTAMLILLLNWSLPYLDAHRWLRDAAADEADMSRYANTCSETNSATVNWTGADHTGKSRWKLECARCACLIEEEAAVVAWDAPRHRTWP